MITQVARPGSEVRISEISLQPMIRFIWSVTAHEWRPCRNRAVVAALVAVALLVLGRFSPDRSFYRDYGILGGIIALVAVWQIVVIACVVCWKRECYNWESTAVAPEVEDAAKAVGEQFPRYLLYVQRYGPYRVLLYRRPGRLSRLRHLAVYHGSSQVDVAAKLNGNSVPVRSLPGRTGVHRR